MAHRTFYPKPSWKLMQARYASVCPCGAKIEEGHQIAWKRGEKARCASCGIPSVPEAPTTGRVADAPTQAPSSGDLKDAVRRRAAERAKIEAQEDAREARKAALDSPVVDQGLVGAREAIAMAIEELDKLDMGFRSAGVAGTDEGLKLAERVVRAFEDAADGIYDEIPGACVAVLKLAKAMER